MTTTNHDIVSGNIALWYRDIPITPEVLKTLDGTVTKECWKYLIGKMCLAEKDKRGETELIQDIYAQIGQDFGYVHPSLKRLINYANSIDCIQRILPDIALGILNGKIRLSLPNAIILAKMEFPDICSVIERLSREKTPASIIIREQKALRIKTERRGRPKRTICESPRPSIKDTPRYNPDAQVNTLAYTVPSWVSMVDRVSACTDFQEVSPTSLSKLIEELKRLRSAADNIMARIMEDA